MTLSSEFTCSQVCLQNDKQLEINLNDSNKHNKKNYRTVFFIYQKTNTTKVKYITCLLFSYLFVLL